MYQEPTVICVEPAGRESKSGRKKLCYLYGIQDEKPPKGTKAFINPQGTQWHMLGQMHKPKHSPRIVSVKQRREEPNQRGQGRKKIVGNWRILT